MLYYVYRIILVVILVALVIIVFKVAHKAMNRKRIIFIIFSAVLGYTLLTLLPVEKTFLRFDTQEKAFDYCYNAKSLIKMVKDDNVAIAIYNNNGRVSNVMIEKDKNGWIMNNSSDGIKFKTVDRYSIVTAEPASHNKIMVLINTVTMNNAEKIQLNINDSNKVKYSKFQFVFSQGTWEFAYTVLSKPLANYQVTINGITTTLP